MRIAIRIAVVAAIVASITGCQVLGSLFEEHTLRALVAFVAVAAVLGFLVSRMRR